MGNELLRLWSMESDGDRAHPAEMELIQTLAAAGVHVEIQGGLVRLTFWDDRLDRGEVQHRIVGRLAMSPLGALALCAQIHQLLGQKGN